MSEEQQPQSRPGPSDGIPSAMTDPMERLIALGLEAAGISFATDLGRGNPSGLDFRLPNGVEIEVKRFHSPRIAEQMARAENVIAIQGDVAVAWFAYLLAASTKGAKE